MKMLSFVSFLFVVTVGFYSRATVMNPCEQIFWGESTYRDANSSDVSDEKLASVHRDAFPVEEWSDQVQFDRLLIEKNADLLRLGKAPQVLIQFRYFHKSAKPGEKAITLAERVFETRDWKPNPLFYVVPHWIPRMELETPVLRPYQIQVTVLGLNCSQKMPVM